jgi:hypothetical protein
MQFLDQLPLRCLVLLLEKGTHCACGVPCKMAKSGIVNGSSQIGAIERVYIGILALHI